MPDVSQLNEAKRNHLKTLGKVLVCWATTMSTSPRADVLPPPSDASIRMLQHPTLIDRYDQFCKSQVIDGPCLIPGPLLHGGGNGLCKRELGPTEQIDLVCLPPQVQIRRVFPAGHFQGPPDRCGEGNLQYSCDTPPTVSDQFCSGKAIGDQCDVGFTVDGKQQTEVGVCEAGQQRENRYYQGRYTVSRPVIQCQPTASVTRKMTETSLFKKLLR
ncbi:MAG: hypothetical protein V4650_00140 [Pseudomonadota bacterium]